MWLMHHWSRQSNCKPDLCNVHDKDTAGEKSENLVVRDQSWFWAPRCAWVLLLPSDPSRTNTWHSSPPGHWLDLLTRVGQQVGIPVTPVHKVWCLLFTWTDNRVSGCAEDSSRVKILLSFTPRTTSADSLMAEVRMNQPFVFMVGYLNKKS